MSIQSGAFRLDINGLRAWAVVFVVLFHFGVPGFSGGFIGVDIFFVISGFLMTGIVLDQLSYSIKLDGSKINYRFSVVRFYLARARRILPALMFLCVILLLVGWFYISVPDYKMLSKHIIWALFFVSNIVFLRESGYFDTASNEKLLLHTWSLSVEWQFYILFPLLLIALWKIFPNKRFIGLVIAVFFLGSLATSVLISSELPETAFYLLKTRAWEMLSGSLVYFFGNKISLSRSIARILELSGFSLIVLSLLFFDASTPWPSYQALVPVMGSVLILLSARDCSFFTGTGVAQWLGKTSYSIYIWHWPLSVTLVFLEFKSNGIAILAALVLTLILGWASWAFIEQPVRQGLVQLSKKKQIFFIFGSIFLIVIPAFFINDNDGVYGRFSPNINAIFDEALNKNPRVAECAKKRENPSESCIYGGDDLRVIVLGDSHAQAVVRSVEKSLQDTSQGVLDWSMGGCPTIMDVKSTGKNQLLCGRFVREAYEISKNIEKSIPILIVNRFSQYIEGPNEPDRKNEVEVPNIYISEPYKSRTGSFYKEMEEGIIETACAFAKYRRVYMMRPIPELKFDVPRTMGRAAMLGHEKRVSVSLDSYRERHQIALEALDSAAERCGVTLLDPTTYLCSNGRCWGDVNGLPIYTDDDHLSARGGKLLIPLFEKMFRPKDAIIPE